MSNLAIYRKYRPLQFDDVLGQDSIIRILKESARQDDFAHAYLFAGPRGTGKTTTARLVAKTSNCAKRHDDKSFRKKGEPCNECDICRKINKGRNLDIIEIDAASNRGIDEIRNLKENIKAPPSSSEHKVFIIDEAHMLTKSAFNALLKTLEEPPSYAILILATTEPDKIPSTITSRTQQFFFKRVPVKKVVGKLKQIAEKENIDVSDEALEIIASSAGGSFRDAESLLDQLTTMDDKEITVAEVEDMIGKVSFDKISRLAGYFLNGNKNKALEEISNIEESGQNLTQFTKDLIRYMRRAAVLANSEEMEKEFKKELIPSHLDKLENHSSIFQKAHMKLLKALIDAYSQMRYSQFPIIPLEVAVIENVESQESVENG